MERNPMKQILFEQKEEKNVKSFNKLYLDFWCWRNGKIEILRDSKNIFFFPQHNHRYRRQEIILKSERNICKSLIS